MKIHPYLPLLLLGSVLALSACVSDEDTRPIPGTLQSTDSKNSENNTPRTNPTPNPEPGSSPGDSSTVRVVPAQ
jgi:hypothetical protein